MRAVIGLGANLGDRFSNLRAATRRLSEVVTVVRSSSVWESDPVGPPQPKYLNAALLISTTRAPLDLLDGLLDIERAMGRVRGERWGPRTIDLDILWIDGVRFESERLMIPHPHLHERAFAIVPLLEVAPDAPYSPPEHTMTKIEGLLVD